MDTAAATRTAPTRSAVTRQGAAEPPRRAPVDGDGELVLGRYRLGRRLGAGAFGTVHRARDERLEREVAVKLVPRERIVGRRFEREARAAARLQHPAIVTLFEAGTDDDGAYLVSELVRGPTLAALLARGRLSDRDLAEIGLALCGGLAHAHEHGIVHRDVKPSNILVPARPSTPAERAKLTDFGVAHVVGGDSLTRTGDVLGTAAYMAPEQAAGRDAGPPADVYSLAVVLYEAFTGVNPVTARGVVGARERLAVHLPPIRRQRRDLPAELAVAIDRALRPRAAERTSIGELATALGAVHGRLCAAPGVVDPPLPLTHPFRRPAPASGPDPLAPADVPAGRHGEPLREDRPPRFAPHLPAAAERGAAAAVSALLVALLLAHLPAAAAVPGAPAALLAALLVLAAPRLGYAVAALGCIALLAAAGHSGQAVVLAALVPWPPVLLPRRPTAWPLAALAPALGAAGLLFAFPAAVARARGLWLRAGLAAAGWLCVLAAEPLTGRLLSAGLSGRRLDAPPLTTAALAARDTVIPLAVSAAWLPALAWALAAAIAPAPPVRLGLSSPARAALAGVWAAGLVAGTVLLAGIAVPGARPQLGSLVLGGVVSAVLILLPRRGESGRLP